MGEIIGLEMRLVVLFEQIKHVYFLFFCFHICFLFDINSSINNQKQNKTEKKEIRL